MILFVIMGITCMTVSFKVTLEISKRLWYTDSCGFIGVRSLIKDSEKMTDLLTLHKYFLSQHLKKGGIAVDFTMGNGHDTKFLSEAVWGGSDAPGHVYAFDVQSAALESTGKLLKESRNPENYTLIHDSHENAGEYVKEPFCAGVFNLGWLPGSDKKITTKRESTLKAISAAIGLIDYDGILLIAVYPDQRRGGLEGEAIAQMLSQISRFELSVSRFQIINSPSSPYFFIAEKK